MQQSNVNTSDFFILNDMKAIINEQILTASPTCKMQFLYVDNQLNKNGSNLILIFNNKYKLPLYIAKFPKLPTFNFLIENEYNALRRLHSDLPSSLKEVILSDYSYYKKNALSILVLPYFQNVTLTNFLHLRFITLKKKIEIVEECCNWLVTFQKYTSNLKKKDNDDVNGDIISYLDYFESKKLKIDMGKFKTAKSIFFSFLNDKDEKVYAHGDFWSGNILVDRHRDIKIIDWPNFKHAQIPAWDFLSFFLTLEQELGNSALASEISNLEKNYFKKLGIESELLVSFKIIFSAVRSLWSEYNYGTFNKYDKVWEHILRQLLVNFNTNKIY